MTRWLPWRTLIHFAIAAAATLGFVKLASELLEGELDAPDRSVTLAIHHALYSPGLSRVMVGITQLGAGLGLAAVVTVVVLALLRAGHRRTAIIMIGNVLAAQLVTYVLKHVFERPRPLLFDEIPLPTSWSFPSGHSVSAMAVYGGIAAMLVNLGIGRRAIVIPAAALLILAIGFSRIYLGVHWPYDVVAGFIAGVPLVVATVHLLHTRSGPRPSGHFTKMNVYSSA
jgi:membrane-associated phospholipid phosphatase